jgi:hypothetical protein
MNQNEADVLNNKELPNRSDAGNDELQGLMESRFREMVVGEVMVI